MVNYNMESNLPSLQNRGDGVDKTTINCSNNTMLDCELLSVEQVGRLLGLSRSTVYSYLNEKTLPAIKIASRTMVKASDLRLFLKSRKSYEGGANEI